MEPLKIKKWSRQTMIEWLCSNDPNGVYKDEDSVAEFGSKMTKKEAYSLIIKQMKG